jgi:hypothetical protein
LLPKKPTTRTVPKTVATDGPTSELVFDVSRSVVADTGVTWSAPL